MRLRPVMMTGATTFIGLVPMLYSSGGGAETHRPLATVVVGGLITFTLLTLLLLPVIYECVKTCGEHVSLKKSSGRIDMKEIKAFIHRNRIADVINALTETGFQRLSVSSVEGMLKALDNKEQDYSLALGEAVISGMKL